MTTSSAACRPDLGFSVRSTHRHNAYGVCHGYRPRLVYLPRRPGSGPAGSACHPVPETAAPRGRKGAGGSLGPLVQPQRAAAQRRAEPGPDVRLLRLPRAPLSDPLAGQESTMAAGGGERSAAAGGLARHRGKPRAGSRGLVAPLPDGSPERTPPGAALHPGRLHPGPAVATGGGAAGPACAGHRHPRLRRHHPQPEGARAGRQPCAPLGERLRALAGADHG
ncbi:hypothetical protein D3C77_82750 [compost metagenome]